MIPLPSVFHWSSTLEDDSAQVGERHALNRSEGRGSIVSHAHAVDLGVPPMGFIDGPVDGLNSPS